MPGCSENARGVWLCEEVRVLVLANRVWLPTSSDFSPPSNRSAVLLARRLLRNNGTRSRRGRMMRYATVVVLPVFGAIVSCAHLPPKSPASAPSPQTEQPHSPPQGGTGSSDSNATVSPSVAPPAVADQSRAAPASSPSSNVAQSTPQTSSGTQSGAPSQTASPMKPKPSSGSRSSGSPPPAPTTASTEKSAASQSPANTSTPAPSAIKATPPSTSAPQAQSLDLATLEQRLKDTRAIGLFTKLSLKNQVDDLLSQFKAFHGGKVPPSLSELHQRYDLVLLKVLSLLQDGDPPLARSISSSREAIWGILSDPQKFATL